MGAAAISTAGSASASSSRSSSPLRRKFSGVMTAPSLAAANMVSQNSVAF